MDRGPEMTAQRAARLVRAQLDSDRLHRAGLAMAEPYVESFHARVRDELLDVEEFPCLAEARVVISDWREDYNTRRPHSALGMRAPPMLAAEWTEPSETPLAA